MTAPIGALPTFDRIRMTASDMFCRDGYKSVGMRRLAAAVGIKPGSLYNHIDSKQALLYDLIVEYELSLLNAFRGLSAGRGRSSLRLVSALWERVEKYVSQNRSLAVLACKECCNLNPTQSDNISIIRRKRILELCRLLGCLPDVNQGARSLEVVAEELNTLLNCNANLAAGSDAHTSEFLRRRLRDMACRLIVGGG